MLLIIHAYDFLVSISSDGFTVEWLQLVEVFSSSWFLATFVYSGLTSHNFIERVYAGIMQ